MNWQEVCENPVLQNIPFKIELNQQGQIIMSPAGVMHVIFQAKIIALLNKHVNQGLVVPEFPVETMDGVKVIDVGLLTPDQVEALDNRASSIFAPILCVEVLSPSNTLIEMDYKKSLYFEKGAKEFWLCDQVGKISFYNRHGQLESSNLIASFPAEV
jgi:Uma2 family endonuclease